MAFTCPPGKNSVGTKRRHRFKPRQGIWKLSDIESSDARRLFFDLRDEEGDFGSGRRQACGGNTWPIWLEQSRTCGFVSRLGHADPSFTLKTYVHLMDEGVGDASFLDSAVTTVETDGQGNDRATSGQRAVRRESKMSRPRQCRIWQPRANMAITRKQP
jgi:hypothetical protein